MTTKVDDTTTSIATTTAAELTANPTTTAEPTTTREALTTTTEITTSQSAEPAVHCCCRCCYDVTSSPLTSSCTVCDDESLADAARCAAQLPPSPTPFTRPTEPNFEAPPKLEGSMFEERLAFTEEFLAKEQLTEMLASISLTEKTALGFTATDFILDCNYDGSPCSFET